MLTKHQPNNHFFFRVILCALFFYSISSCDSANYTNNQPIEIENDSILILIDQGRSTNIPIEERALLLQNAQIAISQTENDTLLPKYYSKLSLAYLKLKDSLLFRVTNRQTIILSKRVKDTISEANAYWDLAVFFKQNTVMDSAFYNYLEANKKFQTVNENYFAGRMMYNMAVIQTDVKDYTGAEISVFKAIELLKPLDENNRLYQSYSLLGSITKELREYERSLEYFEIAKKFLDKNEEEIEKSLDYSRLQNNIGNVYKDQGDYKQAKEYYTKAVYSRDSLMHTNPLDYVKHLNNLTFCRFKLGDTLNVIRDLELAKKIRKEQEDIEGLSLSHYTFAEYYLSQNDTVNALANAKLATQFAQESTNNKRLLASLGLLAQLDSKNSLGYSQWYIKLNDSLVQAERQERNKFTRIRFETDEFIAENEVLTRKKQIWTGVALGVFLLGVSVYVIIDQRLKNQGLRFQQQQQASNQEIFELMLSQKQKIEDTKKGEQKRISEELHDGVLGKMLGARMVLTGLNKRSNEEAIEERAIAIAALKDVEGEVRAISHELSHAAYHKINNFINSIQELLKNISNANGLNHTFEYDDNFDWDSINGDVKINLYRMVQEIMQNAVKHAECKNILVNFVRATNEVNITITDDGKGFKAKLGKKGIGMRNIESRVSKLGGTWAIESIINKGTTIKLHIPFEASTSQSEIKIKKQDLQNIK